MKVSQCLICSEKVRISAVGVISPWIRALGVKSRYTRYLICQECDLGFFSKRYDEQEMKYIYSDYRQEKYLGVRCKWEPWYTKTYNSGHNSDNWVTLRKNSIEDFLRECGHFSFSEIVDIGGDRGQYIPDLTHKKIVFDISDKEPLNGLHKIKSLDELDGVELIIYAHVLEHVADPLKELERLVTKSKHVYVEVPFGVPRISKARKSVFRLIIKSVATCSPLLWGMLAFPATGRKVESKSTLIQSEHLSFYSEKSLEKLANRLGSSLLIKKTKILTPDLQEAQVLQCLLTLR